MSQNNRNKTKRNNKNKNKTNNQGIPGPMSQITAYSGPTRLPVSMQPEVRTEQLQIQLPVTSTAGGVIDGFASIGTSSSVVRSVASDFSSWSGLYREYRVLSLRAEYHPNVKDAVPVAGAIIYQPVYSVVDRDDLSAVGAINNIISNSSLELHTLNEPWVRETKMQSIGESNFVGVATDPTSFFVVKIFATGVSASASYGTILVRWLLQFRTRD